MLTKILQLNVLSLLVFTVAASSGDRHRYNVGDRVPLFVNKVGPLHNPSETYHYYDLPFCRPDPIIQKKESLGEVLNGDRLTNTLYHLTFQEGKIGETLCKKKLRSDEVSKFRNAIANDFYFQMYYDDLPFWGFVGKVEKDDPALDKNRPRYCLFQHVQFDVFYYGDQIIEIHAFSDPNQVVDVTEDVEISVKFTYSVSWNATTTLFQDRMKRYSQASLHPINQQIHWFSLINATVVILLLMGLFTLLFMRRLNNDLRICSGGDEEEDTEVGWKYIRGDVFRFPSHPSLFCAILGSGMQLLTMLLFLFVLAFFGILYPYNRGMLCTTLVLAYSVTSLVAGYTSAYFHSQFAETGWERSVLLSGISYPAPLFLIQSILNVVAVAYGSTAALPFGTICVIVLLYTLLAFPLLALGGIIGKRLSSQFQAPSVTNKHVRQIPPLAWYGKGPSQMFLAGLLCFSVIVLELHQVSTSLWGYKISVLPGTLFVTFVILLILTAILSVGLTYVQLSSEDHEWWWRSLLRGGTTAIFMFGHCIYFYAKSNMSGMLQFSVFLGYSAFLCYGFFLLLGTVGVFASLAFVRQIYQAIKNE